MKFPVVIVGLALCGLIILPIFTGSDSTPGTGAHTASDLPLKVPAPPHAAESWPGSGRASTKARG
jgi:hypothetical protein